MKKVFVNNYMASCSLMTGTQKGKGSRTKLQKEFEDPTWIFD